MSEIDQLREQRDALLSLLPRTVIAVTLASKTLDCPGTGKEAAGHECKDCNDSVDPSYEVRGALNTVKHYLNALIDAPESFLPEDLKERLRHHREMKPTHQPKPAPIETVIKKARAAVAEALAHEKNTFPMMFIDQGEAWADGTPEGGPEAYYLCVCEPPTPGSIYSDPLGGFYSKCSICGKRIKNAVLSKPILGTGAFEDLKRRGEEEYQKRFLDLDAFPALKWMRDNVEVVSIGLSDGIPFKESFDRELRKLLAAGPGIVARPLDCDGTQLMVGDRVRCSQGAEGVVVALEVTTFLLITDRSAQWGASVKFSNDYTSGWATTGLKLLERSE